MNLDPALGLLCLAVLLASFFWVRGIVRGRKDDLIAGLAIAAVLGAILLGTSLSTGAFADIGAIAAWFGLVTLAASAFAKPSCPLNRGERAALGVGFMIAGLWLSVML
jgi:hypothetical protein